MKSSTRLTALQLRKAADIQERIEALTRELNRLLLGTAESDNGQRKMIRRRMSAAGRARIAAAARLRWKKAKAAGKTTL